MTFNVTHFVTNAHVNLFWSTSDPHHDEGIQTFNFLIASEDGLNLDNAVGVYITLVNL